VSAASSPTPNEQAHRRARACDSRPGRSGPADPRAARRGARPGRDRSCPAGAGPRGRAHADQHRAPASGDPRRAAARGRARRRDRGAGDPPPRLSPLGLREAGGYRHYNQIIPHMVWLGTTSIDLGAFTPFLWAFQERERIYNLQEMWTGARLTTSVTRVGGMMADIPDDFVAGLR